MRRCNFSVRVIALVLALGGTLGSAVSGFAQGAPRAATQAFMFPTSMANGLASDLVAPVGTAAKFSFEVGKVALGQLPVPFPASAARRGHRSRRQFVRPTDTAPHARLFLSGVVDADGAAVNNTGNQLIVDAAVTPSGAASEAPPFVFQFDIANGIAFMDVALPIQIQADGSVRFQVLGVSVVDPEGQPFAVLGFELPPARPTPIQLTPTPGGTPVREGLCYVGTDCTGASFSASQDKCCRLLGRPSAVPMNMSWCPPDQVDPATGRCAANACINCMPPSPLADCGDRPMCSGPCTVTCADGQIQAGQCQQGANCQCNAPCARPTPTPGPCADSATCGGACAVVCADGTNVSGECAAGADNTCRCSASCAAPTPCTVGQCFDTITLQCTGQSCGPGLRCSLPNQLCDASGRRCPCGPPPPPLPHGRVCCQCKAPGPACFDFSFAEVQPLCPQGCETFFGQQCDASGSGCVAVTPCGSDRDCDDGNGCTVDRCTANGCTHDCVCVGPNGCGPGPRRRPHH